MNVNHYILLLSCQDRPGIVNDITNALLGVNANIVDADQHSTDFEFGVFFIRIEFVISEDFQNQDLHLQRVVEELEILLNTKVNLFKKKNRVIFKLKPAILNGFMGLYMIIFHFLNRPILIEIFKKYPQLIPSESRSIFLTNHGQILLKNLSFTLGVALILHGIIVGYSGVKHNNFWWTVVNIVGLLIAIIMASLCAIII